MAANPGRSILATAPRQFQNNAGGATGAALNDADWRSSAFDVELSKALTGNRSDRSPAVAAAEGRMKRRQAAARTNGLIMQAAEKATNGTTVLSLPSDESDSAERHLVG